MHWLQALGRSAIGWINGLGRATLFLVDLVACLGELRRRFAEVMAQLHNIGVLTLSISSTAETNCTVRVNHTAKLAQGAAVVLPASKLKLVNDSEIVNVS